LFNGEGEDQLLAKGGRKVSNKSKSFLHTEKERKDARPHPHRPAQEGLKEPGTKKFATNQRLLILLVPPRNLAMPQKTKKKYNPKGQSSSELGRTNCNTSRPPSQRGRTVQPAHPSLKKSHAISRGLPGIGKKNGIQKKFAGSK